MIDPKNVPSIGSGELLARFIKSSKQFAASTGRVKQDAFIPPKNLKLSVTRHLHATMDEIWDLGRVFVAGQDSPTKLYGRADIVSDNAGNLGLSVAAVPVPDNPNHADVLGWPEDKSAQKEIALLLAESAVFSPAP